jgi:hypothetical protein
MNRLWLRGLSGLLCILFISFWNTPPAWAFCGFFVAKADAKVYNSSSRVIIARNENRSIFMMANDFKGDVQDFARIVPIPVIPKREQVRIGDKELVEQLDAFTAPRLVQYYDNVDALWDNEVAGYLFLGLILGGISLVIALIVLSYRSKRLGEFLIVLFLLGLLTAAVLPSLLPQYNKGNPNRHPASALNVTVEDQFTVGEYDITILSAEQSNDLTTWLIQNGYKITANAQSMLQDYIKQGMKFFVVKVNLEAFEKEGFGFLRPIVLDYESPKFMLPIRLGTLNATADQDLIIHILSPTSYAEVANYRTVLIPTDAKSGRTKPSGEELPAFIQEEFGKFYETVFQREYEREGKNVAFLEYAGSLAIDNSGMAKCDPCTLPPEGITKIQELLKAEGLANFPYITRLHVRYTQEKFPKDLVFKEVSENELLAKVRNAGKYFLNRASVVFQGRYVIRRPQDSASGVAKWRYGRWKNQWAKNVVKLTGWDIKELRKKMALHDDTVALANALTQQGQKLENSQKYEEALVYYNKAVNVDPGNVTAWLNRGLSLYELERLEEALTSLDKAVALDANNWFTRNQRDELRRELGR